MENKDIARCLYETADLMEIAGEDSFRIRSYRNGAGEWCCGAGDCFVIPSDQVTMTGDGYMILGVERVPFMEAQPSPDGAFWRCKRPDGSRRCFFAPPPST